MRQAVSYTHLDVYKRQAQMDPEKVHGLNLIIPAISRAEHLDLFERGIAREVNFAYAGAQSLRLAQMLAENKLRIGAIHTYLELYLSLIHI